MKNEMKLGAEKNAIKSEKISLVSAIILNINIMVGSAIIAFPQLMTGVAGNASFLAWGVIALLFLPLVLSVAKLSQLFPNGGGFFTYTKEGLGKTAGYFSGWLYIVGFTFAITLEGLALHKILMSRCLHFTWIDNSLVFNFLLMGSLILFNMLSLKQLSRFLSFFTFCKILPIIILILCIPFIINPNFTITSTEIFSLPWALPWAIFGYFGFESCCNITQHIENNKKNGARAIVIGFLITTAIYMLFHFGLLNLMGSQNLTECGASNYASFLNMKIPYLKEFINWLIPISALIAIYATTVGILNANAEILYAMAQENLFYGSQTLTQVNRYGRPYLMLLLQGSVVFMILALIPSITVVTGLCNVGVFMAYLMPFVSLFILQKNAQDHKNIILTILSIIIIIGLITYSWLLMADTLLERLFYTALLCLFAGLGLFAKKSEK